MHTRYPHGLNLSLAALLAAGCTLDNVVVGGDFRDGDGDEASSDTNESAGDESSSGEPPAEEPPPNEPPAEEPQPNEPPPLDEAGPLHTALTDCVFNMVWTKSPYSNQMRGLEKGQVAVQTATTLEFEAAGHNEWVFPGVFGASVLAIELIEIDAVTGEYVLGGTVTGPQAVMTLPQLRLDPNAPVVVSYEKELEPAGVGSATLTSLIDDSQEVFELHWGLVVDLNGGSNPACEPLLEAVYGDL